MRKFAVRAQQAHCNGLNLPKAGVVDLKTSVDEMASDRTLKHQGVHSASLRAFRSFKRALQQHYAREIDAPHPPAIKLSRLTGIDRRQFR